MWMQHFASERNHKFNKSVNFANRYKSTSTHTLFLLSNFFEKKPIKMKWNEMKLHFEWDAVRSVFPCTQKCIILNFSIRIFFFICFFQLKHSLGTLWKREKDDKENCTVYSTSYYFCCAHILLWIEFASSDAHYNVNNNFASIKMS